MPQIAANYKFTSKEPNFARDQVQTYEELLNYGGWNTGDSRYPNENQKTDIDLGHIVYVVERNQHYTYVKITEVDPETKEPTGGFHYGWAPLSGFGSSYTGGEGGEEGGGEGDPDVPTPLNVYAYFKSMVFKRGSVNVPPQKPGNGLAPGESDFGGTFFNPVPYGWSDGIPAITSEGEKAIWMTTRVFSSGGPDDDAQQAEWTAPSIIADTEFRDFEFSSVKDNPGVPQKTNPLDNTDYGDGWSNTASESTIWMAMRDCESGQYKSGSSWDIVKIKGEDGEQALKIKILGKKTSVDELAAISDPQYLDAYLVGDDVYVWDGDSWENSGRFKGEYDSTKGWAYLHIKYSDDGHSFTSFGGEVPGKWVGTYCDYNIQDSSNFNDYYWKQVAGGDGFGYEYIYKLTIDDQAPDVPNDHTNNEGKDWEDFDFIPNNWTDNPGGVDSTWRWCWVCYRVKLNGTWSEFKGANGKTAEEGGKAALYAHYGKDGEAASSASRDFMIFTWTGLNTNLDPAIPFVPLKPEDNVAKWNISENTLDLNPDQTWNWSFGGASGVWSVNPGNEQNKYLWMSTATFSQDRDGEIVNHWSDPVCLTGNDGRNGTDGIDTAFGYHLCDSDAEFATLTAPVLQDTHEPDSFVPSSGWTDHPQGISPSHPIEAASVGSYNKETDTWSYGTPFIWAKWGEDGIDGDGIEYLFFVAAEEDVVKSDILDSGNNKIGENVELKVSHWLPTTREQLEEFLGNDEEKLDTYYHDRFNEWVPSGTGWTDDPSDVGPFQPYEFVVIRKYQYNKDTKEGKWGYFSEPALWAKYGKDGEAGRSVFTSFAFTRTIKDLSSAKLSGGTVELPIPEVTKDASDNVIDITWTDSIPSDNNAPVWMTSRIFDDSLTGEGTGWKTPTKLQDSPNFQVEYTDEEVWNTSALPSLNDYVDWTNFPEEGIDEPAWRLAAQEATNAKWGDIGEDQNDIVDPWWMITARRSNGRWSSWAIHKIKGEKGEAGTSISVKGSFDSYKDLGDLSGEPVGQVNHSEVQKGDCYVIGGLLWIYDDNSTKSSPYSTEYVTDPEGTGQALGDKYAGFSCQGQFKGDPGESSWIHVRFANESEATGEELQTLIDNGFVCEFNGIYIELTGSSHLGNVPGKYAGIAITHDVNIAPTNINAYAWSEWKGDDIYGTEQIFTLSTDVPEKPTRPNDVDEKTWNTHDYVPSGWSDTPLSPTPDEHCWVTTRRLSDPEDKTWKTPVIYTRYAKDGNNGIDGAVNEFIYHLGERDLEPEIDLSKAKKGADTVESEATLEWWSSDDSRDYRPFDGEGYWADNPQGVSDEEGKHIEYYAYRTREYDDANNKYVWTSWSPVKIWSSWGQKGRDGDGIEYIFTLTKIFKTPSNPTPYTTVDGEQIIDTEAVDGNGKSWSSFDYAPTISVASDYDPEDTDFIEHEWFDDPQSVNSVWRYQWVSMRRSHSDAEGNAQWSEFTNPVEWNRYTEDGKDGRTEEFIYFLSKYDSNENPIAPTIDSSRAQTPEGEVLTGLTSESWQELEDCVPALGNPETFGGRWDPTYYDKIYWSDNPFSISFEWPIEYRSSRFKKDGVWSGWTTPSVWSAWGLTGHDGDGVEYIFTRTSNASIVPVLTAESGAFDDNNEKAWEDDDFVPKTTIPGTDPVISLDWTDDPQGVTKDLRVEWVSIRKTFNGVWATEGEHKKWSEPKIWKEYDESILEERVYHFGGKTEDPILNEYWDFRGNKYEDRKINGFIPSDVRSDSPTEKPESWYQGDAEYDPNGWTPYPKGITSENRYEYEAIRRKNPETGIWGQFVGPTIYAAWGEDGDSVEFVFWMISQDQYAWIEQQDDVIPNDEGTDGNGRTRIDKEYLPTLELFDNDSDVTNNVSLPAYDDQPADPDTAYPYVYYSKREKRSGEWQAFSPIRLYTKLFVAPEYSCTLNLEEDNQGVMVVEEGDTYKSVSKFISVGLTDTDLRYGASSLIIGKVEVQPVNKTVNGTTINAALGNRVTVWETADGSTNSTSIVVDGNTINISVTKNDTFYFVWFNWSASNGLTFKKDSEGNPIDLSFIIYASGGTAEGSTEKVGYATYNIHPINGDTLYELSPTYDLFKKRSGSSPFNIRTISSFVWKESRAEDKTIRTWANSTDWNEDPLEIHYRVDDRDPVVVSGTLAADGTISGSDTTSETNPFSWTLSEHTSEKGEKYIYFTINLYEGDINFAKDIEDGITIQIYQDGVLHDEEFIPVVYNGKKGNRGDYYKEETAYYISQSDSAPSAPDTNVVLVTPSGTDSNDAEKWLNAAVSPTVTYRYLYAAKRLNRYYGDSDSELGQEADTISEPGTWEAPFLYASRSVGTQGNAGRGIVRRAEYYRWTLTNEAPSKTPLTDWTEGSVPTAGENDKYLWNFEVTTYTSDPFTEETNVECVGNVSEDGRSITGLIEYYLWSDRNSGITVEGNTWYVADALPDPAAGEIYLWNYEEITYDKEPMVVTTNPIVVSISGKSISSVTEYYKWTATEAEKPSNSSTSGWTANTIPASSTVTNAKYLWNFESVSYNYGAATKTPVALLTTLVEDGRGISGVDEYYIWWNSGTTAPTKEEPGWYQSNNPNSPTETNKYLWNYEVIHFDNGSADLETDPVLLSQNGTDGAVGRGINSIKEYYLWTASSTLTTGSTNASQAYTATISNPNSPSESTYGWDTSNNSKWYTSPTYITEAQIASKGYKYLWNFEILSYTSGTSTTRTSPAIIGTIGEDGRGIVSITEYYLWSDKDSVSQIPAVGNDSWKPVDQLPTPTGNQKYLWNYESVVYTDSETPVNSTPIIISVKGDKGDDGKYSQFVYFRSKNELDNTKLSRVTAGDVTVGSGDSAELLPCWRYDGGQYISAKSSGTYKSGTDFGTVTDDPSGISDDWRYEYESMGTNDNGNWTFSTPALHNYMAEDGQPGTTRVELFKVSANTTPTLSNNEATKDSLIADGWMPLGVALNAGQELGVSNYDIWMIYATYAADGSEDSQSKVWIGPTLYNAIRKGDSGLAGAVVRGPVKWEEAQVGRRWYSGNEADTDGIRWIDIVTYTTGSGDTAETHYYKCTTSHNHTGSTSDIYVPGNDPDYWAGADSEFKFIATDLLLATNAKINVLSNNALLLMDNQDEVVGGARGGDSADDVIFWAGTEESNMTALESAIPSAPFRVTFDGSLTSTKGNIAGWEIGPKALSASYTYTSNDYSGLNNGPKISLSTSYTYVSNKPTTTDTTMNLRGHGLDGTSHVNMMAYGGQLQDHTLSLGPASISFNTVLSTSNGQTVTVDSNRSASFSGTGITFESDTWNSGDVILRSDYTEQGTRNLDVVDLNSRGIEFSKSVGSVSSSTVTRSATIGLDGLYVSNNSTTIFQVDPDSDSVTLPGNIKTELRNSYSGSGLVRQTPMVNERAMILSAGAILFRIAILIDPSESSTLFTKSGNEWYFNGTATGVSATEYPNLTNADGGLYYFSGSSGTIFTGVLTNTSTNRNSNTIYIEI